MVEQLTKALADRYAIERELGAGGMATVYLARDHRHDRRVALKVLRPELAAVIGAERFLAEIKTTANLQHPHILPLHDSGEVDGTVFYVMPFVEGESLRDRLARETQLPVADAVRIASEVANALDYAHRKGIVHRDIKPENILLHDGQALVADFGIALAAANTGDTRMTETGMSLGTPHYMSPEQAMGERSLDGRTDVFALGCVLYEMLAGEPPFDGPTAQAIVAKVMSGDPDELTQLRRTVPGHVAAAAHTALQKLPADRFESAHAFAEALSDASFTTTVPHRRSSPGDASWRRHFRAAPAVAVVLGIVAAWGWFRQTGNPPREVIRFELGIPGTGGANGAPSIALSPDGRSLAYVAPTEDGSSTLFVRHLDRLDPIEVERGAFGPVFAPDGRSIAWVGPSGELQVKPIDGGASRTVQADVSVFDGLAWSDDGYVYYTMPVERDIWRVPVAGGESEFVVGQDTLGRQPGAALWPRLVDPLPGGGAILVTYFRGAEPADVALVDLMSGDITYLFKGYQARYAAERIFFVNLDGALMMVPFDARRREINGPERSTGITVLTDFQFESAAQFAISRSGTLVYKPDTGTAGRSLLAWVRRDGTEEIVDVNLWRRFNSVSLSHAGDRIAMGINNMGGDAIWTYHLNRRTVSRLTFDGRTVNRPRWSHDDSQIGYVSDRESELGIRSLWIQPSDGSGAPEQLVESGERPVQELTWSADGRSAAYREGYSDGRTQRDIWALRAGADTTRRPLLATDADEDSPQLSPDGRWLAYTSDQSGAREVYVQPFPDGPGRWQISNGGGREPLWGRDGKEVFYRSREGDMVAVPVGDGTSFTTGTPEALFSTAGYLSDLSSTTYDIAPDGSRFLMIKQPTDEVLVMVVNWVEETGN